MSARVLDGKAIAAEVRAGVAARALALSAKGITPGLAVVLVGEDPASQVYVRSKTKAAREAGVTVFDTLLGANTSQSELAALVTQLNNDPRVDGILVQLPLPKHLDAKSILDGISPDKDVDGLHPVNVGRLWTGAPRFVPCTPRGCMHLLTHAGVEIDGARAVVIGRSNLVGRPMAALLEHANATVTICHSHTANLAFEVSRGDIVVAAMGKPEAILGEWIREGAAVLDVGTNRVEGKLVGDVEFAAASERASVITPVPGGVGPMTIAMLLANTVDAASRRAT